MEATNGLLAILQFTIPALIVWGVVYWMSKTFLGQYWQNTLYKQQINLKKEAIPMKIQALERLALFCERIQPSQVLSRVQAPDGNAQALGKAMLIAVQKEYEHNVTQQVYVSEPLWGIIYLAKNEVLNLITECMDQVEPEAGSRELATLIIRSENAWQLNPVLQALQAIRKEASVILNP